MTKICGMISFGLAVIAGSLYADEQLADVRKALADGLPDVALYRLASLPASASTPDAVLLKARAFNALGRYEEAVQALQPQQNLADEAKLVLARAEGKTGRLDEALALYRALSVDPQYAVEACLSQAAILEKLGQPEKAAQLLDDCAKSGPLAPELALKLAEVRLGEGNAAAAHTLLDGVSGLAGDQLAAQQYLLAKVNLAEGKTAEAEKILAEIKSPSSQIAADVVTLRGDALVRQKDFGEAERVLEDFLEKNPNSPALDGPFLLLDRVYAAQGAASARSSSAGRRIHPLRPAPSSPFFSWPKARRATARSSAVASSSASFYRRLPLVPFWRMRPASPWPSPTRRRDFFPRLSTPCRERPKPAGPDSCAG